MHITSSYFRCRQHQNTLDSGVSGSLVRIVENAALDTEHQFCEWPKSVEPLRPSERTLELLACRYKPTNKDRVA